MEYTITTTGLILCLAGVFLAWHKKGAGVWATFIFGFSLIMISGALGERLRGLSISDKGLTIDL